MKKGMFFSLSVIVFVVVMFIVFRNKAEGLKFKEESFMDRAQTNVMQHFSEDFENRYVKEMLETSAKEAFTKRSRGSVPGKNKGTRHPAPTIRHIHVENFFMCLDFSTCT